MRKRMPRTRRNHLTQALEKQLKHFIVLTTSMVHATAENQSRRKALLIWCKWRKGDTTKKRDSKTHKPVTTDSTRSQTTTNGEDSSLRDFSVNLVLPRTQGRTLQPRAPCLHLTVTSMLRPPPRGGQSLSPWLVLLQLSDVFLLPVTFSERKTKQISK